MVPRKIAESCYWKWSPRRTEIGHILRRVIFLLSAMLLIGMATMAATVAQTQPIGGTLVGASIAIGDASTGIVTLEKTEDYHFRVFLDGRPIGRVPGAYAQIEGRYFDPAAGPITLLATAPGGNLCNGGYFVVDMRRPDPLIPVELGGCSSTARIVAAEPDLIVSFHGGQTQEVWFYDGVTVQKLGTLTVEGHVERAIQAIGQQNYRLALRHLLAAEDREDPRADLWLGRLFHHGWAVVTDYNLAHEFYRRAAEAGSAAAMFRLGTLYANGRGVPKDVKKAAELYARAAEHGDTSGQFNFALALAIGKGVKKNEDEALRWFLIVRPSLIQEAEIKAADQQIAKLKQRLGTARSEKARLAAQSFEPAGRPEWSFPQDWAAWVGRYPFDRVRGVTFLDLPDLRSRLRTMLPSDALTRIDELVVASPIERHGTWIVASGCEPHNCSDANYSVVIHERSLEIALCLEDASLEEGTRELRWFRTGVAPRSRKLAYGQDVECVPHDSDPVPAIGDTTPQVQAPARSPEGDGTKSAGIAPGFVPPQLPPHVAAEPKSSGSAFQINDAGHFVTNHHVIEACTRVTLRRADVMVDAQVIASDRHHDLAVLAADLPSRTPLPLQTDRPVRLAEAIIVTGHPYKGLLASTPQVTTGTVSALAGIGDDTGIMQVQAPIQPGNSGGPIINLQGAAVGVAVATLDAAKILIATGSLPQNVNFGIKINAVRDLLDANGISYEAARATTILPLEEAAERAVAAVAAVQCY